MKHHSSASTSVYALLLSATPFLDGVYVKVNNFEKQSTLYKHQKIFMKIMRTIGLVAAWVLGLLFFFVGLVNVGWGNDQVFGLFIIGLSVLFFPPVRFFVQRKSGFTVPVWLLVILALFIFWSSVGVGELFDKIGMMRNALGC